MPLPPHSSTAVKGAARIWWRAIALLLVTGLAGPALAQQPTQEKGAWLGLKHLRTLTRESASARGFEGPGGVLVYYIYPDSPAARAGIKADDILVEIDGRQTLDGEILTAVLRSRKPGATVEVTLFRNRRLRSLPVTLGDRSEKPWERLPSAETLTADYNKAVEVYNGGDKSRALDLFRRVMEQGLHYPCYNLAYMHEHGEGGLFKDLRLAARWYRLCGELRTNLGAYELGQLYLRGAGVDQDEVRAYYWFSVGAEADNQDAVKARDEMARILTLSQIEEAEELARTLPDPAAVEASTAAPKPQAPTPKAVPAASEEVREVQRLLARLGYRPGPADGLMGRKTRNAIEGFQKDRGLPADGAASPDLLARLRSAAAEAPAMPSPAAKASAKPEDLGNLEDLSDF